MLDKEATKAILRFLGSNPAYFVVPFLVGIVLAVFSFVAPISIYGAALDPGRGRWLILALGLLSFAFSLFVGVVHVARRGGQTAVVKTPPPPVRERPKPAPPVLPSQESIQKRIVGLLGGGVSLSQFDLHQKLGFAPGDPQSTAAVQEAIGVLLGLKTIEGDPNLRGRFRPRKTV